MSGWASGAWSALLAITAGLGAGAAVESHERVASPQPKGTSYKLMRVAVAQAAEDTVPGPKGEGGVAGGIGVVCAATGTPAQCQLPGLGIAYTSDVQAGYKVAERISNTTGAAAVITKLCWWGIYADFNATPNADCSDDPANALDAFTVTFFDNDNTQGCPNSVPGAVKAGPWVQGVDFAVVAKGPTGDSFGAFLEFEYSITLPSGGVALADGECAWVEIQNDSTGTTSPSCLWLWETAPPPDGYAVQDINSDGDYLDPGDAIPDDLALCVDMALGSTAQCNFDLAPGCAGATGPCGAPHPTPGCEDACCCTAVCAQLPLCCLFAWDQNCAKVGIALGCYSCDAPAPANDCCTSPTVVGDGASLAFDSAAANSDGAPEGVAGECIPNGTVGKDLWYAFTAPEAGTLVVSTCNTADYDTTLEIYNVGNGVYDCQDVKDQVGLIGCNDDGGPLASTPCGLTSHVMADVSAGTHYLVRLGGFNGLSGTGTISFDFTPGVDLFDTGLEEPVTGSGTPNSLVGFPCGNLTPNVPGLVQRRTAQAFTVPPATHPWQITQVWVQGYKPPVATNTQLTLEVFHRTSLTVPPGPADLVASRTVPYPVAFDEPTINLADPKFRHVISAPPFNLAPGAYWLTVYASNDQPGVVTSQFAWLTNAPNGINNACPLLPGGCVNSPGCTGAPDGAPAMWRSCTYPVPGFQSYLNALIAVDPVNDPTPDAADLYNTSFKVRGRACIWDCGDNNGVVNVVDFLALLQQWGQTGTPCDFGNNGVDTVDFLALLQHWGQCP